MTTLAGDPASDCIMSTKVIGEDIVLLARGSPSAGVDREIVRYERLGDGRERELVLECLERGSRGEVLSARIDGVQVRGTDLDVPLLYHALSNRQVIHQREIKRFRRTGFLGGQTPAADKHRICSCLGIGKRELLAASTEHGGDLDAICAMLGIGSVCGACLPRAAEAIQSPTRLTASVPALPTLPRQVKSKLVVRRPRIEYDVRTLQQLSAEPQIHALAVASLFATIGERFMVQRIGAVLPTLTDRGLVADVEVFLEQESQHIAAHEPFNRLLLDHIYRDNRALHRCAHGMVGGIERVSTRVGLAVSAYFEHLADCAFAAFLQDYYGRNRRFSTDPTVHDLIDRSGVGALFLWHAGEEMSHRHVAFDVMRASGAGWFTRLAAVGLRAVVRPHIRVTLHEHAPAEARSPLPPAHCHLTNSVVVVRPRNAFSSARLPSEKRALPLPGRARAGSGALSRSVMPHDCTCNGLPGRPIAVRLSAYSRLNR